MQSALFSPEMVGRGQMLMVHWIIFFINLTWSIIVFCRSHFYVAPKSWTLPSIWNRIRKNLEKKMEFAKGKTSDLCKLAIRRQNLEKALIKNQKICSWQNLKHELMLSGCHLRTQFALPHIMIIEVLRIPEALWSLETPQDFWKQD